MQKHMDTLPVGFPATPSGVEIRLSKRFFTPEEARIATCLSMTPQSVANIYERARKTGISIAELQTKLDHMVNKGCIIAVKEDGQKLYRNAVLVVGIYESQVNRLTPELLQDMALYTREAFGREIFQVRTPQVRTIPVGKSIPLPEKYHVGRYDNVRELIDNNTGQLAVANCICRQAMDLRGQSCSVSDLRELCLILDGEPYIDMGLARPITPEEAFDILDKAREAGFVLQPLNSQRPDAICCCCGDCCGILRNIKQFPHPADYYVSNFYAEIDPELCTGCQVCVERCQLDAPYMTDGIAAINLDRCIGCGNCVVTCEAGAVQLKKKDEETIPPRNSEDLYKKIAAERATRKQL